MLIFHKLFLFVFAVILGGHLTSCKPRRVEGDTSSSPATIKLAGPKSLTGIIDAEANGKPLQVPFSMTFEAVAFELTSTKSVKINFVSSQADVKAWVAEHMGFTTQALDNSGQDFHCKDTYCGAFWENSKPTENDPGKDRNFSFLATIQYPWPDQTSKQVNLLITYYDKKSKNYETYEIAPEKIKVE